jgi:hypothetical protein
VLPLAGAPLIKDVSLINVLILDALLLFVGRLLVARRRAGPVTLGGAGGWPVYLSVAAGITNRSVDVLVALTPGVLFLELRSVSPCAVPLTSGSCVTYHR